MGFKKKVFLAMSLLGYCLVFSFKSGPWGYSVAQARPMLAYMYAAIALYLAVAKFDRKFIFRNVVIAYVLVGLLTAFVFWLLSYAGGKISFCPRISIASVLILPLTVGDWYILFPIIYGYRILPERMNDKESVMDENE